MSTTCTERDTQCCEEVLQRVAADLSMIADRDFVLESLTAERANERAAGRDEVHISFRLSLERGGETRFGCLLVPLADAISLACYLLMIPDESVEGRRLATDLDETTKDALLEVGSFIGSAADAALRDLSYQDTHVAFDGCQGVRPDVRPALVYSEGDPLLVARASARIHDHAAFELILMLPALAE